jgi:hypothetical protein
MQKITLTTETRRCINPNTFLGYEGENNANKLIFEFTDGFIDGLAVLKVERGEAKGTIDLVKAEETYELEVKSSLLAVQGDIKFQFVITEPDGTITKYDPFIMTVKDALDADGELPEEYPSWQEIIATELAKVEKATENANKVAEDLIEAQQNGEFNGKNGVSPMAKVERISNGAKITVTDTNGTTTAEVYDGEGTDVEVPTKVSQLENDSKFATESYVKNEIANAQLNGDNTDIDLSGYATKDDLKNKVDKVAGKSLVDDTEIARLKNVTNYDDTGIKKDLTEISQDLDNINQDLVDKANKNDIPDISGKQDKLVSGTNIKTINGESILGEGNIEIKGGGTSGGGSATKNVLFDGEWTKTAEFSPANTLSDSIYNYDIVYVTTFQRKDEAGATYTRIMTFTVIPDLIQENFIGSVGNTLWTVECNTGNNLGYAMEGNFGDGTQIAISTLTTQSNASSRLHGICKVVGVKY